MTTSVSNKEQAEALKKVIEERLKKITDVRSRIERQKDHIDKTVKKKERFEEHMARWLRQNDRDIKKLKELEKKDESTE